MKQKPERQQAGTGFGLEAIARGGVVNFRWFGVEEKDPDSVYPILIIVNVARGTVHQYVYGSLDAFRDHITDKGQKMHQPSRWEMYIHGVKWDAPRNEMPARKQVEHVAYCLELQESFFDAVDES